MNFATTMHECMDSLYLLSRVMRVTSFVKEQRKLKNVNMKPRSAFDGDAIIYYLYHGTN